MNESDIRVAFDTRLEGALSDESNYPNLLDIPVAWENTPNKTDQKWLRTQLQTLNSENGVIGAANVSDPYIKHDGHYVISIFTQLNKGAQVSDLLIAELTTRFQNKTFVGVMVMAPSPRKIGDDEHGYFMVNLFIPFVTVS